MNVDIQNLKFLVGKKVVLRPLLESDLPNCLRWINDPEVRQFLKSVFPMNDEAELEWHRNRHKRKDDILLAIIVDGKHIGNMGLHRINWKDRRATTGALIGEKDYWGRGYGTDAKMALLHYAFNTLNLNKVCSSVIAFNERSLHYSLKCGYKVEGTLRKHIFRNGDYWDEIVLGVFREEWLPVWEKYTTSK